MMKIGEVAKRAGIPTSTIRYYEQIGLLPPPRRVSGQRVYDSSILETLGIIAVSQRHGFSLSEIADLLHCEDQSAHVQWRSVAAQKLDEIDVEIQRLQAMKQSLAAGMECECTSFDDCEMMQH